MREVVIYGDPVLEARSEPVLEFDQELELLCKEMFEAMHHDRGIGLAAPQVGVPKRIFITEVDGDRQRVFINPEIIMTSLEESEYEEGCLSFPGLYFMVKRPATVKVQARDERGKVFSLEAEGLLARVILHENDHLDGKLFIDRISNFKRERALRHYERLVKM